jgi:hypothetical protein
MQPRRPVIALRPGSKAPGESREHVDGGRGQIEVLLRNPTLPSG